MYVARTVVTVMYICSVMQVRTHDDVMMRMTTELHWYHWTSARYYKDVFTRQLNEYAINNISDNNSTDNKILAIGCMPLPSLHVGLHLDNQIAIVSVSYQQSSVR